MRIVRLVSTAGKLFYGDLHAAPVVDGGVEQRALISTTSRTATASSGCDPPRCSPLSLLSTGRQDRGVHDRLRSSLDVSPGRNKRPDAADRTEQRDRLRAPDLRRRLGAPSAYGTGGGLSAPSAVDWLEQRDAGERRSRRPSIPTWRSPRITRSSSWVGSATRRPPTSSKFGYASHTQPRRARAVRGPRRRPTSDRGTASVNDPPLVGPDGTIAYGSGPDVAFTPPRVAETAREHDLRPHRGQRHHHGLGPRGGNFRDAPAIPWRTCATAYSTIPARRRAARWIARRCSA